jgi:hypothetical protein
VDNVQFSYNGLVEPVILNKETVYTFAGGHVGATNVNHSISFYPFRVPIPRPDTIYVDQDITVFYRDTGEELIHFHYQTQAKLHRNRRWHIIDIIEGT